MAGLLNLRDAQRIWANGSEVQSLWIAGQRWDKPVLLSDFYGVGPGRIALHINTDGAVLDGSGRVTGLVNHGGAGPHFDATVVGQPIQINADHTISITPSSGAPKLSNSADIMGVRFAFVIEFDHLVTNDRLFGGSNSTGSRFEVQHIIGANNLRRIRSWSNVSGTGSATNQGWEAIPTSGFHIVEIELTNNLMRLWIDGVERNSATSVWSDTTPFVLDFIGSAWNGTGTLTARYGDVLGIALGAGQNDAIAAARSYLSSKFNISLSA